MKKIILASDGKNLPKGAFEFIKQLQQAEPLLLTGVFLRPVNFEQFLPNVFAIYAGPAEELLEEEKAVYEKNIRQFETVCQHNGIEYRVHEESEHWDISELEKETRFADMMIMSEELFCTDLNASQPNAFMQQAIHRSECPVILVPEEFKMFNKIVIAYDGGKDSMFALKQFCNCFPQFKQMETLIIYANAEANDEMPQIAYIEEYAGRHFSHLNFEKLHFKGQEYFESWVKENSEMLLVCGSYSQPGVYTLLRKSFAKDIIRNHTAPLFIAHH